MKLFSFLSFKSLNDLAAENKALERERNSWRTSSNIWRAKCEDLHEKLKAAQPLIRVGKARLAALDKAKAKRASRP